MMDFRPIFKKCFSVLLGVNLLTVQVPFAGQAEAVFWSARRQEAQKRPCVLADGRSLSAQFPALSSCLSPRSDSVTAAVPPDFLKRHKMLFAALSPAHGTLRKILLAKNPAAPVVIHIQDVHMNREAQKNIRDTVYALGQSGQVDFVALEGATQKIDLDPFWNYPNPKAVSVTANYLLKENKISGPIHAALSLGKTRIPFLGIDDPVHYKANVKAYQSAAPHQREARADVRAFQRDLAGKKQTAYSPALLALDKTVNDFRAEKIALGNYVETLAKITPPPVVAHSFLKAVRAERTLDIKKVEDEQAKLIEKLSRTLSANDMDRLLAQSVAYRAGQVRSGDFYSALENICRINGLRLADFPAMDAYVQYVTLTDGIDAEKLMIEIADLEQAAYDRLAVSPSERALVAKSRQGFLAEKLINCDLTRLEWEEYVVKREKFFNGELAGFESFYREADARDHSMADNLLKKLVPQEDGHPPIAVLVTGGYHAKGMADQLVRHGVTVISYVPKISKVETGQGTAYLSVFTQEKTPLEKLFVGEKLFLSPPPAQGLNFEGPLLIPAVDVLDRGITAEAIQDFIQARTQQKVDVKVQEANVKKGRAAYHVRIGDEKFSIHIQVQEDREVVFAQVLQSGEASFLSVLKDFLIDAQARIHLNRGRRVEPTVVRFSGPSVVGIHVAERAFKQDGVGILDFKRVENQYEENGEPVLWANYLATWAKYGVPVGELAQRAGVTSETHSVGLPTNNVGLNYGYMVYRDGVIYQKSGETDAASLHLWLVSDRKGTSVFRNLQFRNEAGRWIPLDETGQVVTDIGVGFRGPTLLTDGRPTINPDEWDDLRHLFRLPVFKLKNFPGGMLTWSFADKVGQLYFDLDLRRKAFAGEAVRLSLASLTQNGVSQEDRDQTFSDWGYIKKGRADQVTRPGHYFVDESSNETVIRLLPGYHPHTVIGQEVSGGMAVVTVGGETNQAGATVSGLAEEMARQGLRMAMFVGNGKDSQIYQGDSATKVAGAYGTANVLLSVASAKGEDPQSTGNSGVPGGIPDQATIDQNLVRIESELRGMEIEDGKVNEVVAKVREVLETGKGFIRPKDPVRLTVYGDRRTGKPLIGPLPTGMNVDDLVPVGDLDWVVVVYTDFWSSTSYVVPFTPDHRIALVQIAWGPYAGMWTFPSGGSMPGYTPEQTAVSEVHDELGLSKGRAIQVKKIGMVPIGSGENEGEGYQVANLFMCQLTEADVLELLNNKKVLEDQRALLGEEKFLEWLGSQTLDQEGTGEISGIRFLTQEEFINSLTSDPHTFAPEFVFFQRCGFLGFDGRPGQSSNRAATGVSEGMPGRATAVRWLKEFEKVGAFFGGERRRAQWGKAYKDFAATIEFSSAFTVMLVALGGTVVLAGSPLGWAVAPLLGAVFGEQFYKGHFLSPGESAPMTAVTVSAPKAFTMAVMYGVLITVTPFLLGFGPAGMAFIHPALAESLWGSAAALHLFFDRKPGARQDGKAAAQNLFNQLSTIPGAFQVLAPITTGRTDQILNSRPFTPDLADEMLGRLQNDSNFRKGFLEQIQQSLHDEKCLPLSIGLLSSLLSAKGEPLGVIHFLGSDPEAELERIKKYSSESVRVTVVAPAAQSSPVWERTESLKAVGVNVVRKNTGDQGWSGSALKELENEMGAWLRSVPSTLIATVGNGVKIDPAEIDRLDAHSRLKAALSNAVSLDDMIDLFFRFLQAVRASA